MAYDVIIKRAENGMIVKAGCMTFVFEDLDHGLNEVAKYVRNPSKIEKEYMEKYCQSVPQPITASGLSAPDCAEDFF